LGGGGRGCFQTRFLRHGVKPGRVLQCSVLQTRFGLRTICKPTLQMISVVLPHRSEELTHTLLTIQSKDFSGGGGLVAASITSGRLVAASTLTPMLPSKPSISVSRGTTVNLFKVNIGHEGLAAECLSNPAHHNRRWSPDDRNVICAPQPRTQTRQVHHLVT
jgi:hypothetical protein